MKDHLKNPLDLLFRDIQRELAARAPQRAPISRHKSTYANPENWTLGKVICLIHDNGEVIGMFQEYFHRLSPSARRLLPAVEGLAAVREELVFGDYWLHPRFSATAPEPDSEQEIQAIVERFHELMALEDELP